MVAVLARLLANLARSSALLELAGAVLIVVAVFSLCRWPWGLVALGIALLLKSAELEMKRAGGGQ